MSEWISIGVPEDIARKLVELGLHKPTETQRKAIPRILHSDKNVLVCAPTGTGKTESALIPALIKYGSSKPVSILYITPLRALNRDIERRVERVASIFGKTVSVWHGDTPSSQRKRIASTPPDILITTPESLQVILVNESVRKHLRNCSCVIIDEVHELAESERGVELVTALRRLDVLAKRRIRRIALTAPYGNLSLLAEFIFYPYQYEIVDVRTAKRYEVSVDTVPPRVNAKGFLDVLYSIPKLVEILRECLNRGSQALVFVNTRVAAEELGYALGRHFRDLGVHHGSLSREIRESVEARLKEGSLGVVVATSSLELGIDIGGVDLVIQVMSPRQVSRLVQRVGRAGHREEATSKGVVVAPPMLLELLESAVIARRVCSEELEEAIIHLKPLDVLLHQLIGLAIEWRKVHIDHALKLFRSTYPFKDLSYSELIDVINLAKSIGFVDYENDVVSARRKGEIYYRTTTMIVDTSKYRVRDVIEIKNIATLDEEFIATCSEGDVLVLGGRLWKLTAIDDKAKTVYVEPVTRIEEAKLPRWVGENIPVSYEVSQEVCKLIESLCSCSDNACIESTLNEYPLSSDAKEVIREIIPDVCKVGISSNRIVFEVSLSRSLPYILIYSCIGTKGSEALAILASEIVRKLLGVNCSYRAHQIGTLIVPSRPLSKEEIKAVITKLMELDLDEARSTVVEGIEHTPLFDWYVLKVSKKMGLISRDVSLREAKRVLEGLKSIDVVKKEAIREIMIEKLDTDSLEKFLSRLKKYKKVRVYIVEKPSRLAREIISLAPTSVELTLPITKSVLSTIVLSKLTSRTVKLLCLSCLYSWSTNLSIHAEGCKTLNDLKEKKIPCPICGSLAVTVVEDDDELRRVRGIVKKLRNSVKLSNEEMKLLDKARKIANLLMDYGLAALITLQGFGVGPESAKRILSRARSLEELAMLVLERESSFLRTRRFWRS